MGLPIATYVEEVGFWRYRKFELFENFIQISIGSKSKNVSVLKFDLNDLKPEANKVYAKNQVMQLFLAVLFFVLLFGSLQVGITIPSLQYYGLAGFILAITIPPILMWKGPKVEYAQFVFKVGTVALDIGKIGKQTNDYAPFVNAVKTQIQKNQN